MQRYFFVNYRKTKSFTWNIFAIIFHPLSNTITLKNDRETHQQNSVLQYRKTRCWPYHKADRTDLASALLYEPSPHLVILDQCQEYTRQQLLALRTVHGSTTQRHGSAADVVTVQRRNTLLNIVFLILQMNRRRHEKT